MDFITRRKVIDIIYSYKNKSTIILSTQLLDEINTACDNVAILDGGQLLCSYNLPTLIRKFGEFRYYYRFFFIFAFIVKCISCVISLFLFCGGIIQIFNFLIVFYVVFFPSFF